MKLKLYIVENMLLLNNNIKYVDNKLFSLDGSMASRESDRGWMRLGYNKL